MFAGKADLSPIYRAVAEALIERIDNGDLLPGSRCPSERQLASEYGISRMTARAAVNLLVQRGYEVYMLDWGVIAEEDKDLGFEDLVFKIVPRAIDRILETANAQEITLNGLCLGGVITSSYLGLNPHAPVKNVVAIVTPIDFAQGGLFKPGWAMITFRSTSWYNALVASLRA